MSVTSTAATSVLLATSSATFTAGGAALTLTATVSPAQQSVPLTFSTIALTGGAGTPSITSGTTDSTGKVTLTLTPSNTAGTGNASAKLKLPVPKTSSVTITTSAGAPSTVTFYLGTPVFPTTHYLITSGTTTNPISGGSPFSGATTAGGSAITWAVTDAFANAATGLSGPPAGTVTAATPSSGVAYFDLVGGALVTSYSISTSTGTVKNYYQTAAYSTTGKITLSIGGTYTPPGGTGVPFSVAGFTGNLISSTLATSSPAPIATNPGVLVTVVTPACAVPPCIPAGKTFTVAAKPVSVAPITSQAGVPITLYALPVSTTQTGTFSNGAKSISVTTNSTGWGAATFNADTKDADSVRFVSNATKLVDGSTVTTLGVSGASSTVITIPGSASTFVVKVSYDNPQSAFVKTSVVAGNAYYVNVALSDPYGNAVTSSSTTQIQITLAATQGVLSATNVYITNTHSDTASSFGPITLTLAAGLTGSVALSASGAVSGVTATGSKTVTIVSPLPTLAVTSPKLSAGAFISGSTSVAFIGQANVSAGYAASVTIKRVGYKVNTGTWQTIPGTSNKQAWSVVASFNSGLNTVQFNATDSSTPANTVLGTAYSLLIDTLAPTITFTTANGAQLTQGTVAATITDTMGDLNATSVSADYNGTKISAASITVTGTNTLGSSVTYTVSAVGLPAGKWKVTLKASDLAGNAATATAITVTVTPQTNQSFTNPTATPPASCTNTGYTGVCSTWTNNLPTTQTVNVWAVAYNSKNQVVFATFSQLTFTVGGSNTVFVALSSTITTSGTYTVQVFVVTPAGTSVSPAGISATVII